MLNLVTLHLLEDFKVISFSHANLPLETIGKLHLEEYSQKTVLSALRANFQLDELLYITTCNRVELLFRTNNQITDYIIEKVIGTINPALALPQIKELEKGSVYLNGELAINHVFKVASSLNSLVVGEREIITQLRKSYDNCNQLKLTGDFMRMLMKQTIETAKQVFTETEIAKNPVSIVSLAYRKLRNLGIKNDARILLIGAGETNTKMANYLQKHKFANFTVFNRTLDKAEQLAEVLNGKALPLSELNEFTGGFDVIIVCTSASQKIITSDIYKNLLQHETEKKVVIDLSLPSGIEESVISENAVTYIDINSLKEQAEQNLKLRQSEIAKCERIIQQRFEEFKKLQRERQVELAFGEIPRKVKAIKDVALTEVFAREISELDTNSKEVLDKVIGYMEKKYNAVAMKTAKDVFLKDE